MNDDERWTMHEQNGWSGMMETTWINEFVRISYIPEKPRHRAKWLIGLSGFVQKIWAEGYRSCNNATLIDPWNEVKHVAPDGDLQWFIYIYIYMHQKKLYDNV